MTLYTRKGDTGTTKAFDTKSGIRISKSSCQTEALGALDELNSFLGIVKIRSRDESWQIIAKRPAEIIFWIQQGLFIVQAEVAGADKHIAVGRVSEVEQLVDVAEKELPPIKTFFISGGTELAALFDFSRTLARRAEREVIRAVESGDVKLAAPTLSFLNRLSSLLYALARLTNHKSGINEVAPTYQ